MARPAVAFLGPAASYTHQAAKAVFAEHPLLPVGNIKDVFEAVRAGDAAFGVVPFENSTHGPVTFTLAALADRDGAYGGLSVCGEVFLRVHHCLLGRPPGSASADLASPSSPSSLAHITRLYSHPQGFGQTTAWVRQHLPQQPETIDASSTSRAAALAAADPSGTSAAISSALAAEATGLAVLARNIEDRPDNTTRFYVLRRAAPAYGAATAAMGATRSKTSSSSVSSSAAPKSLVSFTVPHRSPGALADVLDCFRRARLNLTSIHSLPSLAQPFQYLFFVEFEHDAADDDVDARVQRVLAEVAAVAQTHRLLGTWNKPAQIE